MADLPKMVDMSHIRYGERKKIKLTHIQLTVLYAYAQLGV
jgi:hypothetical protein